jgi:cytochrome d ubiquinol oxidase subunit II
MDLPLIWAGIIAFAIFAYVVMDGFDLGIGILFPHLKPGAERDQAMNSIAPYWDGNETWLVMGGGGLLAVFPLAYAVLLPATYPLIIAMLLGLIFRGVAFEFRWRDPAHVVIWDRAFVIGSTVAALAQGMILGAILQGIRVENNAYAGGALDWLSPFTVLTGVGLVLGYALLGAGWLIWRTDGPLQNRARNMAFGLAFLVLGMLGIVSLAMFLLEPDYWRRWFSFPRFLFLAPLPVLAALAALRLILSVDRKADHIPFFMALAIFLAGFAALGLSLFPDIIPPSVTIRAAAAPPESLSFLLVGAVVIIPMILGYMAWAYWVFRGKTRSGSHR